MPRYYPVSFTNVSNKDVVPKGVKNQNPGERTN